MGKARVNLADHQLLERFPAPVRALARETSQPSWVPPMLATLTDEPFSRRGWLFEPKFDGERCLTFCHDGNIRLLSRIQHLLNETYPELVQAFEKPNGISFIIDGEIVAFQDSITSFAKLQQRMQEKHPSVELRRKAPVVFCAFDLLYLGSFDLRDVALRDRKRLLRQALVFKSPLRYTQHRESNGEAYYREACRSGMEGIIAKDGDSTYTSTRSSDWLKFKCVNEQEFVIGGYTDPKGRRSAFGALLIGYYREGKLSYAGKVGTGYDTATLHALGKRLKAAEVATCPFDPCDAEGRGAHWVKPTLIAQIGFTEWTKDGKLRHPRFLGLRNDKKARDVVQEKAG